MIDSSLTADLYLHAVPYLQTSFSDIISSGLLEPFVARLSWVLFDVVSTGEL
jgi:hypothetical protein